jgi:hypothetical protein
MKVRLKAFASNFETKSEVEIGREIEGSEPPRIWSGNCPFTLWVRLVSKLL